MIVVHVRLSKQQALVVESRSWDDILQWRSLKNSEKILIILIQLAIFYLTVLLMQALAKIFEDLTVPTLTTQLRRRKVKMKENPEGKIL